MAVIAGQEMAITNQAMATASETTDLVMADTGDLSTTDFEICQKLTKRIPSQIEVAPPHRTVDITQKRVLSKNTKETEKM